MPCMDLRQENTGALVQPPIRQAQQQQQQQQQQTSEAKPYRTVVCIIKDDTYGSAARSMRRTCDTCFDSKKRCSGNGIDPCSLCIDRELTTCTYRMRRGRRSGLSGKRSSRLQPSTVSERLETKAAPTTIVHVSQSCSTSYPNMSSLKRCRLSPSLATGLVGTEENMLLTDFYRSAGLAPLFPQSVIREAMVSILSSPLYVGVDGTEPTEGIPATCRAATTVAAKRFLTGGDMTSIGPVNLKTCKFWAAVAAGGVLRGQSVESVQGYIDLAQDILAHCLDEDPYEIASVHIGLACWGGLSQNGALYKSSLQEAARACAMQDSRPEVQKKSAFISANVAQLKGMMIFHGDCQNLADVESLVRYKIHRAELPEVMTMEEVVKCVLASTLHFSHAFLSDMYHHYNERELISTVEITTPPWKTLEAEKHLTWAGTSPLPGDPDGISRSVRVISTSDKVHNAPPRWRPAAVVGGCGGEDQGRSDTDTCVNVGVADEAVVSSYLSGGSDGDDGEVIPLPATLAFLHEVMQKRERLLQIAKRVLALARAAVGDLEGAMETVPECVDVINLYPGLLRSTLGIHTVHCLMTIVAAADRHTLYSQLRDHYNTVCVPGTRPVPPLDEWQGVGFFCTHIFCRLMERQTLRGNQTRCDSPSSPRSPAAPTKFQDCEESVTLPVVPHAVSASGTDASEIPMGDGVVPTLAAQVANATATPTPSTFASPRGSSSVPPARPGFETSGSAQGGGRRRPTEDVNAQDWLEAMELLRR